MSLDNNSANNFKDFLDAIKPFLNYQLYDMSGMGVEAFRFSTDEKPVGMWTDGKILYAKTVDCGALPNNTSKNVSRGLTSVDIKLIFGHAKNPTSGYTIPLNHATFDGGAVSIYYNYSNNNIVVKDYENKTSFTESYVTLFYTKTTDSPLSSDEKFAGVTSGGEVIYERTISCTINIPNTGYNLDTSTYGINRLLDFEISGEQSGVVYVGRWGMNLQANKQSIKIEPITGNFSVNGTFIIKLRYTKSS